MTRNVFQLKGADRKHKQDREKVMKKPLMDREKYQQSYDCTVFTEVNNLLLKIKIIF